MPDTMPERMSEYMPERKSDGMSEYTSIAIHCILNIFPDGM